MENMNYSTEQALKDLSISEDSLSESNKLKLLNDGYCTIYISPEEWKKIAKWCKKEDIRMRLEGKHPDQQQKNSST